MGKSAAAIVLPIIGMFIATGAILWYRGTKTPTITIPPAPPIPHPNAYEDFALAYHQFHDLKLIEDSLAGENHLRPDLSNGLKGITQARTDQVAAENKTAIAMLEHGLSEGYCAPPITSLSQTIPYAANDRAIGRALSFDGRVAARQGDWRRVMRDSVDSLEFGTKICDGGGPMIAKLDGLAIESIGRVNAWSAIAHLGSVDAATDALHIEGVVDTRTPYWQTLQNEEDQNTVCLMQEFKQRHPLGDMTGERVFNNDVVESVYFTFHPKANSLRMYRKFMDTVVSNAKLPYPAAKKAGDPKVPNDIICDILCPVFNPIFKDTADVVFDRLLSTTLALRAYNLDHNGAYPATLGALSPHYLRHVPMDPFENGAIPLIYHRTGHGYLLYSIGPDGKDDGGKPFIHKLTDGTTTQRWCMPDDTGDIVVGINKG